jgi:predicted permease
VTRFYALLLYLYPPSFRRAHGAEVLQFVRDAGGSHAWLLADLVRAAPREWYHAARARGRRTARPVPVERRNPMRSIVHDIQHSARLLVRNPGFTAAAVVTLALGIGANTAIFSLADATLLRPLDIARPDRLVQLDWSSSYPDYKVYADWHDVFSGTMAAGGATRVSLDLGAGAAELRPVTFVSGNTFDVLGVAAALGRTLLPSDDVPNGPVVAVLGHDFWRQRLGGRRDIVGTTIRVNGISASIVGVAREGFRGISLTGNPAIYFPVTAAPQIHTGFLARHNTLTYNGLVWLSVVGRLRDGVTAEQAAEAMNTMYRRLHPPRQGSTMERLTVTPLATRALGSSAATVRQFVFLLAGVVGLTLLIACANLANLLLVHAATRRREIGIRLAVGASKARVVRQVLIESLLLAGAGGAAGLLVAGVGLDLLSAYQLPGGLAIDGLDLGVNRSAVAAAAILAVLTGAIFGSAPAWRASRSDVMLALRNESRGSTAGSRLRGALVAVQVALSLALLAGSALFFAVWSACSASRSGSIRQA